MIGFDLIYILDYFKETRRSELIDYKVQFRIKVALIGLAKDW